MKRKIMYAIGVILLLLIFTNPGPDAFKDFIPPEIGYPNWAIDKGGDVYYGRKTNYLVCSVYEVKVLRDPIYYFNVKTRIYYGFLGNFFLKEVKITH